VHVVGVRVIDGEVVEDVAELRPRPHLPPAQADRLDRVLVLHRPGDLVQVVDVLLDVEVARQPGEVVPVAHLPFHVGPPIAPGDDPDRAAQVVGLQRDDVPQRARVDAVDALIHVISAPQVYDRYRSAFEHSLVVVEGRLQKEEGLFNVLAERAALLPARQCDSTAITSV